MSDTKISALTGATTLTGVEVAPVVQSAATVGATVNQIRDYIKSQYGLVQNNVATSDPTTTSDGAHGYAEGSFWWNKATGFAWICRDATTNAAIWTLLSPATQAGYVAGNWYPSYNSLFNSTSASSSILMYAPVMFRETCTISDLGTWVQASEAGSTFQLGIFAGDPATRRPVAGSGPLAYTLASLTGASVGYVPGSLVSNLKVEAGRLYFWSAAASSGVTLRFGACTSTDISLPYFMGDNATTPAAAGSYRTASLAVSGILSQADTYSNMNLKTVGTLAWNATARMPAIDFKVTSVP